MPILTPIVFIPLLGALIILLIPKQNERAIKIVALIATAACVLLAFNLYNSFDRSTTEMQFVERHSWIESFNIEYFLGIDGLSVTMVLLTALLSFLCIPASWTIDRGIKGYFALFLLLETGMQGVFCSLDFFLFYVFWEVMLLPMYFLIGIWGGPRREYAAIKFFLFTLLGSVVLLLAMLAFYFTTEPHTFDMTALMTHRYGFTFQIAVYVAMFIGFAIKVPIFPFHTWLPDAHVEAPTAVSVILAGVLLKMGTYGILRFNFQMLPDATKYFAIPLAILGVINIIYGALCAMAQTDLKKLVAYSSISHMGFVLLGAASLTSAGINGAVLQMFNHGTTTAMLFLLVGVIYDRAHHRDIDGFGGLGSRMPIYTGITALTFFASLGLPGLSSFISEIMCFLGAFQTFWTDHRWIVIIPTLGVVLTAGYFLWTLQRMFLGPLNPKYEDLPEISKREIFSLAPLGAIVIFLGVYPMPILNLMSTSLNNIISMVAP